MPDLRSKLRTAGRWGRTPPPPHAALRGGRPSPERHPRFRPKPPKGEALYFVRPEGRITFSRPPSPAASRTLHFSRPRPIGFDAGPRTTSSTRLRTPPVWGGSGGWVCGDAQAGMPSGQASGATCVQRLDDSRNSAIHTRYRISLRSSSLQEPRYPLLRVVVLVFDSGPHRRSEGEPSCSVSRLMFLRVLVGKKKNGPDGPPKTGSQRGRGEPGPGPPAASLTEERGAGSPEPRGMGHSSRQRTQCPLYAHGPAPRPGHAIGGPTSG